ncbi:NAD(P)H pyrophosphatase NUDT13, mitochondrial-like isoform X1 [Homarus americanus]|uniref:NAD(P)H pyrophosphatase NUDT13, mitochondrial-like isoform X1 n=1 Tax=Homarus americanus TaxID=6706 RepID=UPI001C496F2C|nr:NAD(P)H pyrophosphatase NUDT13, mitochondrial-like isoform X1 [Homarus americanus]
MMISTLFKRISLINLLPRLLQRNISYVERVRFLQQLKEQDTVCSSHIPGGKFLLYSQSKPLIHVDKANTEDVLLWLTYSEVTEYYPQVLSSSVLVDVNEDGTPRYSVQVGALPTTTQDKLESATGAVFTDLRLALFMVSWRDAHTLSRANNVLMWNKNNAFCGKCGAPTARNAAGYARKCKSCNTTHYPSSIPVGIVLVTDPSHESIVLVRQPRHPPGMYSCIAGFSEVGETLEETVHREVAEEVGIEVSSVRYVASQHWPFPGSLMAGCFAVAEKQQLTKDNNELQDARWFSRDEVSTALDKINANPHLRLRGNPSGELFIPPPGAIAYHLIAHWIKGTPVQEIYQHIY